MEKVTLSDSGQEVGFLSHLLTEVNLQVENLAHLILADFFVFELWGIYRSSNIRDRAWRIPSAEGHARIHICEQRVRLSMLDDTVG